MPLRLMEMDGDFIDQCLFFVMFLCHFLLSSTICLKAHLARKHFYTA